MAEETNSKICKKCREQIQKKARRCPHCTSYQTILYQPQFYGIVITAMFISIYAVIIALLFDKGEDYIDFRDKIQITESEIKFGESECGSTVIVLGKIKNNSEYSWEDIHFEVTFFNEDNKMIDADQENKYSLILPKNEESFFKLKFKRDFPEQEYVIHSVRVISAREAYTFF